MTKTAFAAAISVSMKSLANFLAMHGAFKGANSASYDNAWAYFKKREMVGLKLPVKKAAKMAKTDDAAATTSDATPTSISTTSTTATAKAPAGTKKAQTSSAGVDISAIHLDGEEDDRVPIFDSCDEVRRKINAHLKKPGVTQAQFCRDILARMPPPPPPPPAAQKPLPIHPTDVPHPFSRTQVCKSPRKHPICPARPLPWHEGRPDWGELQRVLRRLRLL